MLSSGSALHRYEIRQYHTRYFVSGIRVATTAYVAGTGVAVVVVVGIKSLLMAELGADKPYNAAPVLVL